MQGGDVGFEGTDLRLRTPSELDLLVRILDELLHPTNVVREGRLEEHMVNGVGGAEVEVLVRLFPDRSGVEDGEKRLRRRFEVDESVFDHESFTPTGWSVSIQT